MLRGPQQAFDLLAKMVSDKGMGEFWQHESKYWQILVRESKDRNKAKKDYQDLFDATRESFPSIANKARLRIGRIDVHEKRFKEALALFDEIIDNRFASDREVVAWAYLSRGNCKMNMPKQGDGKAQFKDALFDLVRVWAHYEDVGGPQAEAMYWSAKCLQYLGEDVKESTRRWQTLFRRIQHDWPGTQWAKLATSEIGA